MRTPEKPWTPVSPLLEGIVCRCRRSLAVGDHVAFEEVHDTPGMVSRSPVIVGCSVCASISVDHSNCHHCHQATDPLVSIGPRKVVRRSQLPKTELGE